MSAVGLFAIGWSSAPGELLPLMPADVPVSLIVPLKV
jgi:hypothetical protein